jgi:hypothetical protein
MIAGILKVPWILEMEFQFFPASVDRYACDDIALAQSAQRTLWELAFNTSSVPTPQGLVTWVKWFPKSLE